MTHLTEQEIRGIVYDRITVTAQRISIMKALLLKHQAQQTETMIERAVQELGFPRPQDINVRDSNAVAQLQALGDHFSWWLCGIEAAWALVRAGIFIPHSGDTRGLATTVQLSSISSGGGSRWGENFDRLSTPRYPTFVDRTRAESGRFFLSDPDLYLQALLPHVPQPEVAEALREAVAAFRADLYMAAIVLLGKASEGIWIELGKTLIAALPASEQERYSRLRNDLDCGNVGFAKKLRDLLKFYETRQQDFVSLGKQANVTLDDMRMMTAWSDTLRESRNIIHYAARAERTHTYETVTSTLLVAAKYFKDLYALSDTATRHAGAATSTP
jgi:hypothetical protein